MLSVLGELVVELIPVPGAGAGPEGTAPQYVARPGGNALNVAVAAGRLGAPVRLLARLGTGPLAANLRRHAELSGVDPGGFVEAAEPVSLAVVGLAPDGSADYGFHVLGAADWQWTDDELARVLPERTAILHVGSISSWTAPGGEAIARLVERLAAEGSALISVDPNIRPMLADGPVGASLGNTSAIVRERLDRLVEHADVVKVSAEDVAWLEPDRTRPRSTPPPGSGPNAARHWCSSPTAAHRCGSRARVTPSCTGGRRGSPSSTRSAPATHWPRGCSPGCSTPASPTGPRSRPYPTTTAAAGGRRCAGRSAELHAGRRRSAHAGRSHGRPRRAMTDLRLVGFEELSATALRDRLLERRAEFWAGSALDDQAVVALHDPLFSHQLGGFGAVARTDDGADAGYLLGVVSADRLAVVQGGGASRVAAAGCGAPAPGAVRRPGRRNRCAGRPGGCGPGRHHRPGARGAVRSRTAPSRGHAGPGADRVLLTRRLPLA